MAEINFSHFAFRLSSYPLFLMYYNDNHYSKITSIRYSINQTFVSINNRELIFLMELKESTILN